MQYRYQATRDDDGQWLITFPEAPNCSARAATEQDIEEAAKAAIESWLDVWVELGSAPLQSDRAVEVRPELAAKIEALKASQVDLQRTTLQSYVALDWTDLQNNWLGNAQNAWRRRATAKRYPPRKQGK